MSNIKKRTLSSEGTLACRTKLIVLLCKEDVLRSLYTGKAPPPLLHDRQIPGSITIDRIAEGNEKETYLCLRSVNRLSKTSSRRPKIFQRTVLQVRFSKMFPLYRGNQELLKCSTLLTRLFRYLSGSCIQKCAYTRNTI